MSQYLINASDLPSGTLPTTPVVIKDNDLAGMFNNFDYKYYQYGIPELSYRKFDGNNTIVKSTDIIQAVEDGYYPIIIVSSNSSSGGGTQIESTGNLLRRKNWMYPSEFLSPGIWGFSYYFYDNNNGPMVIFTCLQQCGDDIIVAKVNNNTQLKTAYDPTLTTPIATPTDYLGRFDIPIVTSTGYWYYTRDLFRPSSTGGTER